MTHRHYNIINLLKTTSTIQHRPHNTGVVNKRDISRLMKETHLIDDVILSKNISLVFVIIVVDVNFDVAVDIAVVVAVDVDVVVVAEVVVVVVFFYLKRLRIVLRCAKAGCGRRKSSS